MNRLLLVAIVSVLLLSGCDREPSTKATPGAAAKTPEAGTITIARKLKVSGFDPVGEPEIRVMSDGSLVIAFKFMPPSYAEDDEKKYADFDKQMEKALGVPVKHEDRKFFAIMKPEKDTAEKAKAFLEGYRKAHEK
jgi:hypothetical protein